MNVKYNVNDVKYNVNDVKCVCFTILKVIKVLIKNSHDVK